MIWRSSTRSRRSPPATATPLKSPNLSSGDWSVQRGPMPLALRVGAALGPARKVISALTAAAFFVLALVAAAKRISDWNSPWGGLRLRTHGPHGHRRGEELRPRSGAPVVSALWVWAASPV